ncbi:MAG TPA: anti-sigma factor [Gemmatimonadaceae bacterium]|jgi:anti-sigma factor RsiW|nr:anti-sigma factor [Gemmatimonadaceae bacterium]
MRCPDCRDALGAYADGELADTERQEIQDHLASCADCAREYERIVATTLSLKEGLVRYAAPDVLKARIRSSLAAEAQAPVTTNRIRAQLRLAAAGIVIAVVSSAITYAAVGASRSSSQSNAIERELLASHIRSLQPGHLTDVASTNQHNVKPWFNGRTDLSPAVPDLAASGFELVGGRLDYASGRTVAVVVYARRQHLINVYSWPATGHGDAAPRATTENGYHLVEWTRGGIELWAVSDLNTSELDQFIATFTMATASR